MQRQRIDSESDTATLAQDTSEPDCDQGWVESAAMLLLLSGGHDGPWTDTELERELSASPLQVQDALAALNGSGLVHLQDELVIVSRAAQRMDQLDL
jgi:hypothetical protein